MTETSRPKLEKAATNRYASATPLERMRQGGIIVAFFIAIIVFSVLSPNFLTRSNLTNVLVQSSINAIIAVGMTFVIVSAGIDLSVGPIAAVVSVVVANTLLKGTPNAQVILLGLGLGLLMGLINGVLISYVKLQPFIATLGTMSLYRGAALIYTNGDPIFNVPKDFRALFTSNYGPIPGPVLLVIVVALLAIALLNFSRIGVYIKAIGGNEEAARLSGVSVNFYKLFTYMLNGFLAALGGLLLLGRLGAAEPVAGAGYELDAIAAAAVGGTSLMGGKGNILGTILGALILSVLRNGLTLLNVQAFYQLLATGGIILVAVIIDRLTRGQN